MLIPFSIILIVWKLGLSENEWPALVLQGGLTLAASLALLYMFFLIPFFTVLPLIGSVACLIGSLLSITFGVLRKPY
jgi:hypothetical protein